MKKIIDTYEKFLHLLMDRFMGVVLTAMGIFLCCVMWLQIFARTFLSVPPAWTEELSRIAFIWFGVLAATYTMWKKQHMSVDILYTFLNPQKKRLCRGFAQVCIILLGFVLFKDGLGLLQIMSIQLTSILRWPMTVFYTVMPISGFLYLIVGIFELLKVINEGKPEQAK